MDLAKYLGIPILHKRVTRKTFNYVLKKFEQPLSGWKARNLSLAGRVTLTKSGLEALPTCTMQAS